MRLDRVVIVGHQQLLLHVVFPEHPQNAESLLCLLDYCVGVGGPTAMCIPKNLQTGTLFTQSSWMYGSGSALFMLHSLHCNKCQHMDMYVVSLKLH